MISKRNQTQKTTYYMIPLHEIARKGKFIETKRISGSLGLRVGAETDHSEHEKSFGDDRNTLKLVCGNSYTSLYIY